MNARMRLAVCLVLAACGGAGDGGKPFGIEPTYDWTAAVECPSGTHATGTACVMDALDSVVFPVAADLGPAVTREDGTQYLRGILFVQFRDIRASAEDAGALAARHGGRVIGAIPPAGLYHLAFAEATSEAALAAIETALAADPAVRETARDEVFGEAPQFAPRARTTDLERVDAASTWAQVQGRPGVAVGDSGKWPFQKIRLTEAWDALHAANPPLSPVKVAILDGRVQQSTFPGVAFAGSRDLRHADYEAADSATVNHGTAVASIVGAPDDGIGTTGILAGLPCVKYDMPAFAVLGEAQKCSSQAECGGADYACVKLAGDSEQVCYTGCGGSLPACPRGTECKNVEVQGFRLDLCRLAIDPGTLTTNAILYGMIAAVQAGARVVNMSFSAQHELGEAAERSRAWHAARLRQVAAWAPGTLFVVSAGNNDDNASRAIPCAAARTDETSPDPDVPASVPNILCVGATGSNDARAVWYDPPPWNNPGGLAPRRTGASNYDAVLASRAIGISAPGDQTLAQYPNGQLRMFGGTSGAAPLVSGTAGLLYAILPGMDGEIAKRLLVTQADPIANEQMGGKRLNAEDAVRKAVEIADKLHPESKGQGECREKDEKPSGGDGENICKVDGLICEWHLGPETGSSLWVGVLDASWVTPTSLNQLGVDVTMPSTGASIAWGVTFHSAGDGDAQMTVTHGSILAKGGNGSVDRGDGSGVQAIVSGTLDVDFSRRGVTGSLSVTAEDGGTLQMDVMGTTDDLPWIE